MEEDVSNYVKIYFMECAAITIARHIKYSPILFCEREINLSADGPFKDCDGTAVKLLRLMYSSYD